MKQDSEKGSKKAGKKTSEKSREVISWKCQTFDELSATSLFELYRLRQQVFVIEQQCIYEDIDATDKTALHVLGWNDGADAPSTLCATLRAYLRIMDLQDNAQTVSIGRVVIAMESRRAGIGTQLMRTALGYIDGIAPKATITLSAQHHLSNFYHTLGFVVASAPYDEDGIPHVHMIKAPAF
ncbi:MAG: ElaA protein [Candidatus Endobugula sp.]